MTPATRRLSRTLLYGFLLWGLGNPGWAASSAARTVPTRVTLQGSIWVAGGPLLLPQDARLLEQPKALEIRSLLGPQAALAPVFGAPDSRQLIVPATLSEVPGHKVAAQTRLEQFSILGTPGEVSSGRTSPERSYELAQWDEAPILRPGSLPTGWVEAPVSGFALPGHALGLHLGFPEAPLRPRAPGADSESRQASRVAAALDSGDWSDPVLDGEEALISAQEAYRRGQITSSQMVTLFLRWEALEDFKPAATARIPVQALASNGEFASEAEEVFGRPQPWKIKPWHTLGLDAQGLERFKRLVQELPPSERVYWVIPIRKDQASGPSQAPWAPAYHAINDALWTQLFRPPATETPDQTEAIVIPSFGMLQAYLDARFGGDAIRLLPSFGPATMRQLMEGIGAGGRIFGLQYPGLVMDTTKAHGFELGKIGLSQHDFYHAYVGSLTPMPYRRLMERVYVLGSEYRKGLKQGEAPLQLLGREIRLDRDWAHAVRWVLGDLFTHRWNGTEGGVGQAFLQDFGPVIQESRIDDSGVITYQKVAGLTALIVRDMTLHPAYWTGFDAPRLVAEMGAEAVAVYQEALHGAKSPVRKGRLSRLISRLPFVGRGS